MMTNPEAVPRNALLIVDAANVVGSVPDGWWRDRHAATERLRDALAPIAASGLSDISDSLAPPLDIVLVVEGAARGVAPRPDVAVQAAAGSADDAIVNLVRAESPRVRAVVTADWELRARVERLGALVVSPRRIHPARSPGSRTSPG